MLWIPDSLYWVPDSLSVELRIPIVSRISGLVEPYSLFNSPGIWVAQLKFSRFWIPRAKLFRIPGCGISYMGATFRIGFFRVRAIRYPLLNEHSLIKTVKTIKIAGVVHANWYLCKVHHYSSGCLGFTQVKIVILDLIIPIINNFCALDAIVPFWTLTFPLERFKVGQVFSLILGLHADIVVLKYVAVC